MSGITTDFINRQPFTLNGALAPATVIAGNATAYEIVKVGGAAAIAIRAKASGAATLKAHWCRPNVDAEKTQSTGAVISTGIDDTTGNPTDVTMTTGGTEYLIQPTHSGETWLKIIVTDTSGSNNTVTYVDVAQRSGAGV
jgi:hypothetical protein